jgi:hypothetical protein
MKEATFPKMLALTTLMGVLVSPMAFAKQMYHWKDEHGKDIFSDQVPPSQVQHKRETLDKNAQVIDVTEKPKTQEQVEADKRLNELKKRQEKIIADQKNDDKKLLSNFLRIEDMLTNHKNKMEALDSQIKDRQTAIKKLEDDLAKQRQEVATNEKNNKKTPAVILNTIEDDEKKIAQLKVEIKEIDAKKEKINKEFVIDKERFLFLTSTKDHPATVNAATNPDKALNQLGLFTCDTPEQCDKAWKIAREFVKNNAKSKINVDTDKLVMTSDPVLVGDLGLSVSKMMAENNKLQLFLDIRCIESEQQKEQCANANVENQRNQLRSQFSNYIRVGLGLGLENKSVPKTTEVPVAPSVTPAKK